MVRNNKNFATISAQSLDIRCKTMRLARILRGLVIYYRYFITATRMFAPSRLDNSACALSEAFSKFSPASKLIPHAILSTCSTISYAFGEKLERKYWLAVAFFEESQQPTYPQVSLMY